jgi:hypothetical protein
LFLAWWGSNALLVAMGFDPIEAKPDAMVLGFTAVVSIATSILFGLGNPSDPHQSRLSARLGLF